MKYVKLTYTHKSFSSARTAFIAIPEDYIFKGTYVEGAQEKLCKKLGFNMNEVVVLDYEFFGEDVLFVM